MLLATLVLVPVNGEHDRLQKRVNLRHGNKSAQMRNVTRFSLKEEEEVAIYLSLFIVWEESLLGIGDIKAICDFVLLGQACERRALLGSRIVVTSSSTILFWISKAIRESKYRTSFSRTKFFFDCADILAFNSRRCL